MKILLIDDHSLLAKSLEIVLSDFTEIDEFLSISNLSVIMSTIKSMQPDIILMDIHLKSIGDTDGLLLSKNILEKFPNQIIIMLSGYDLPVYINESKKLGAKGFINKSVEPSTLIDILVKVYNGDSYFINDVEGLVELTISEKKVLQLLVRGIKRKEIARQLFTSERTVSNHLQHIFVKLNVTSAIEATTKAIQMGYISPIS